jgi:glutamate-1-semialdehyde aminotransferase
VKTGSEAVSAAVKLARMGTFRSGVLVGDWAYHGWHDWFQAGQAQEWSPQEMKRWSIAAGDAWANGTPCLASFDVWKYKHNDVGSLEAAVKEIKAAGTGPGAILYEPHRQQPADESFLKALRAIADREGCALIFDEMVYGFRWAVRGGAEFYDIEPDLQTFGKGMGNGQAVACVCGKRAWMELADGPISSTYGGDTVGLAAANAVLTMCQKDPKWVDRLWNIGESLQQGWNKIPNKGVALGGFPVHPQPLYGDGVDYPQFQREMAQRGVLIHDANFNITTAHGDVIGDVLAAAEASFDAMGVTA